MLNLFLFLTLSNHVHACHSSEIHAGLQTSKGWQEQRQRMCTGGSARGRTPPRRPGIQARNFCDGCPHGGIPLEKCPLHARSRRKGIYCKNVELIYREGFGLADPPLQLADIMRLRPMLVAASAILSSTWAGRIRGPSACGGSIAKSWPRCLLRLSCWNFNFAVRELRVNSRRIALHAFRMHSSI